MTLEIKIVEDIFSNLWVILKTVEKCGSYSMSLYGAHLKYKKSSQSLSAIYF